MSLINDAMKAAQRERDRHSGGRPSPAPAHGILSFASEGAGLPRGAVLFLAVLAIIASVGTALIVLHQASPARAAEVVQQGTTTKHEIAELRPKARVQSPPPLAEKVVFQQKSVHVASSSPT